MDERERTEIELGGSLTPPPPRPSLVKRHRRVYVRIELYLEREGRKSFPIIKYLQGPLKNKKFNFSIKAKKSDGEIENSEINIYEEDGNYL